MFSTTKIFQKNLLTPGILLGVLFSQPISESIPVHTYSIVALDAETGELGVAVQSHWFSVGSLVPWAKAGVGAVATQSFVKVDYGPDGLKLMDRYEGKCSSPYGIQMYLCRRAPDWK